MALICNIATGTFFQTIITIILSCSIIQFRRSSQIPYYFTDNIYLELQTKF